MFVHRRSANPMSENPKIDRLRAMKIELRRHYDRFKELRSSGQDEEALQQFNVTLKVASQLMDASTDVLKDLAARNRCEEAAEPVEGKVLYFPRSKHTH